MQRVDPAGTAAIRPGVDVIVLPGTGSDAQFVREAFDSAVTSRGATLHAVEPDPADLVRGYVDALDRAARDATEPVVVGGVSIGAAVAARWVASRTATGADVAEIGGLMAAMPAWTGRAAEAAAALNARATADFLESDGLEAAIDAMTSGSPSWLARMLTRSWRHQWPLLPNALRAAAAYDSPAIRDLAGVTVPTAIVAAVDDRIHPIEVAEEWFDAVPLAAMATFALEELGLRHDVLGYLAIDALESAQLLHGRS